jgi:lysine 2,3-aminomutase
LNDTAIFPHSPDRRFAFHDFQEIRAAIGKWIKLSENEPRKKRKMSDVKTARPVWKPAGRVHTGEQPFKYPLQREFVEPDWRRLPGYKDVTASEWETALWQRRHTVKNLKEVQAVFGPLLPQTLLESMERDIKERATMSILIPPQMLNTMDEKDLWNDPVRRYMLPAFDDRNPDWPSHPKSSRDSLHESDMWAVEGLTHRYPTKVLAEMLSTCPQYCGHCTRMDLVGNDVPQVFKLRFQLPQKDRYEQMLDYLRKTPSVRDVVVSGGDIANMPIAQLEPFVSALMDTPNIKDIRLATKGLMGIPQHFLQDEVLKGFERLAKKAREHDVDLALHTHVNNASQVTPLVAKATKNILELGFRDVRNQGVLLRGVNTNAKDLLELCFTLLDRAKIMPYYFYMCDMIPNSEHWRLAIHEAQQLQHDIMGYLPGFATPRMICDVPFVGKRWVHQLKDYDREKGISYWTKNYRTGIEADDPEALNRLYEYYDPVYTLPASGQEWWRRQSPVFAER